MFVYFLSHSQFTAICPRLLSSLTARSNIQSYVVLRSSEIQKLFVFLGSDDLWPILLILSAVPGLIVSFFFPCVPESPRYLLIIKKDKERAEKGISSEDGKKSLFPVHDLSVMYTIKNA